MACGGGVPMGLTEEPAGGRKVFCVKFQKEMPALDEIPFEGHPIGQRIYENVSKEAAGLRPAEGEVVREQGRGASRRCGSAVARGRFEATFPHFRAHCPGRR